MKTMTKTILSSLFLAFVLSGCVKDDNPFPAIDNTSWKRVTDNGWLRLSFSDGKVHYEIYENNTLSEYDAVFTGGDEMGRHFYSWTIQEIEKAYRVYRAGTENVMISVYPFMNGQPSFLQSSYAFLFDREH